MVSANQRNTYQLLTIVVAFNNAVVGDADWYDQYVCDGPSAQRVHNNGQHARTCWGRFTTPRASTLQVDFQELLLTQQLLCVLRQET